MIAGLPMYDFPELHTVVDAWWSGLVCAFRAEGVEGVRELGQVAPNLPV
jgi:hypothetical protein